MDGILWNRLKYVLSPQFDIYKSISTITRGKTADIGSGTGFGTHLLTLNSDEVHGFEIDENAIRFAQEVFPFKQLHFQYGDIVKGINHNTFQYVIMIDVIEHIEQDKEALLNAKNMLAKGGTFICATPNRLSRYRKSENHVREYTPKELETLLKQVFILVNLKNYRLEPLISPYENPILAICRNGEWASIKSNKEAKKDGI